MSLAVTFPDVLFLLGTTLLTFILLRRSYRYFGRRPRPRVEHPLAAVPRPTYDWSGVQADPLARIEREKVELHRLARDLTGRLDSKLILLQELVDTTQQHISEAERLLDEARRQSAASAAPDPESVRPAP